MVRRRTVIGGLVVGLMISTPALAFPHFPLPHFPFPHFRIYQSVTVDGLAAVVGGDPIFLSDVWNAQRMHLLDPEGSLRAVAVPQTLEAGDEVLQRLIDRRLVLDEIARYAPLGPSQSDIDAAVARWRARAQADGVDTTAENPAAVAFIVDTLRIERYIAQRFTAAAQPTREEARAYYQSNQASFARDGAVPDFEDVEGEARSRLGEERRIAMVRDWLAGLRNRAQVYVVLRLRD